MTTSYSYHNYQKIATPLGSLYSKKAVKGFPRLHPALMLLLSHVATLPLHDVAHFMDITDSAGVGLLTTAQKVTVAGTSHASLLCAKHNLSQCVEHNVPQRAEHSSLQHQQKMVYPAASWQLESTSADMLIMLPHTDRGTARVRADIQGAANTLKKGGIAYMVMHKDQGAKRYEKMARAIFGELDIIAKDAGWRMIALRKTHDRQQAVAPENFVVEGLELQASAGVFAAGKLDKGSALLLDTLDLAAYQGKTVLDVGCGYGILSLALARAGAQVSALDDDWLAVQSCQANAARHGYAIRVFHSDVDSALMPDDTFEAIVMNPPFHLGKQVLLDIPQAFLAAAKQRLQAGGHVTLVANRALPYETILDSWTCWKELARNTSFKVLRAWV